MPLSGRANWQRLAPPRSRGNPSHSWPLPQPPRLWPFSSRPQKSPIFTPPPSPAPQGAGKKCQKWVRFGRKAPKTNPFLTNLFPPPSGKRGYGGMGKPPKIKKAKLQGAFNPKLNVCSGQSPLQTFNFGRCPFPRDGGRGRGWGQQKMVDSRAGPTETIDTGVSTSSSILRT